MALLGAAEAFLALLWQFCRCKKTNDKKKKKKIFRIFGTFFGKMCRYWYVFDDFWYVFDNFGTISVRFLEISNF